MGSNPNQFQDIRNLCGESDGGACQELVEQDLHRVEPVEWFGVGAVCDSLIVVAFAEVPEADLIEIVEAEGAGEGIDELDVICRGGDDVGEVEGVEVGVADDGLVVDVADDGLG